MLFGLFLLFLQLSWTKEKVRDALYNRGLTVDSVDGEPPFKWALSGLRITTEGSSIDISHVRLRIAILPLLRGELCISYLELDDTQIEYGPSSSHSFSFSFPWSFSVKSFKADSIHIKNKATGQKGDFSLRGKGHVRRLCKSFYFDAQLASPHLVASSSISGSRRTKHITTNLRADLKSKEALSPFGVLPADIDASLELDVAGPWKTWQAFFYPHKDVVYLKPLDGHLKIDMRKLDLPQLEGLDAPGFIDASFALSADRTFDISSVSLKSELFCFKGSAFLRSDLWPEKCSISFLFPHLSRLSPYFSGILSGDIQLSESKIEMSLASDKISCGNLTYTGLAGQAIGHKHASTYLGTLQLEAKHPDLPIAAASQFSWKPGTTVSFTQIALTAPETKLMGDVHYNFSEKTASGGLTLQARDLSPFAILAPGSKLKGGLGAHLDFQGLNTLFNVRGRNIQCYDLLSKEWSLSGSVSELFSNPKGNLSIEGESFYLKSFFFDRLQFESSWIEDRFPFTLSIEGHWKTPFNLSSKGSFAFTSTFFDLQLDQLSGHILEKSLSLEKPFSFHKSEKALLITETKLFFAEGYLQGALDWNLQSSKINLKAEHFPIDLLALTTSRFTLNGTCALDVSIEGQNDQMQGRANFLLERGAILPSGKQTPILSKGSVQTNIENEHAQIHAIFHASGDQFCELALTLPLLNFGVNPDKPLAGELTAEGHLEEIFDFINIGSHRTTGNISAHLLLAQTLQDPALHGTFELKHGSYENYFTGIQFQDINASGHAEHGHLFITDLSAKDASTGTLTATGKISVSPDFHFAIDGRLNELQILDIPWLSARASGNALLSGTARDATLKGSLALSRADLQIPDRLPSDLPILPITFRHPPEHLKNSVFSLEPSYPFYYDLELTAQDAIYLTGRGLEAELAGRLHIAGHNLAIEPKGTLHLVKGKFHFGGKEFIITQGDISFGENSSHLNLTATLNLSDMTVYAHLRGPLQSPVLTFQSTPALPTSSVLARILFNKDISELTAAQLLQLADAIVSLSGGAAPSVLDSIRQSIGVDRLNIVSGESDTIAVQIGKYLAEGVMVTLSQSAESSQVIVEVELKGGFILQAETQEDDQGKFSLKWNMNY